MPPLPVQPPLAGALTSGRFLWFRFPSLDHLHYVVHRPQRLLRLTHYPVPHLLVQNLLEYLDCRFATTRSKPYWYRSRHYEEAMRRMNSVQSHPSAALLGVANKPPLTWELPQPKRPIALKVATLLDGKGATLRDTVVVVS